MIALAGNVNAEDSVPVLFVLEKRVDHDSVDRVRALATSHDQEDPAILDAQLSPPLRGFANRAPLPRLGHGRSERIASFKGSCQ